MLENSVANAEEQFILVVSQNCLQKQFLVAALNQVSGWTCLCETCLTKFSLFNKTPLKEAVILIDCFGLKSGRILSALNREWKSHLKQHMVALFNLLPDNQIEIEALGLGVRGFFYQKGHFHRLKKGIDAILNQEIWVSRQKLSVCVSRGGRPGSKSAPGKSAGGVELTVREREVLDLMADGATNADIARTLYLSIHTVRTHNYNIFRKINVTNRVEASRWCTENL